jgi:Zn-dependent protease
MWVAFAGPFANLLIAIVVAITLLCTTEQGITFIGMQEGIFDYRIHFFQLLVLVNVLLFVFNLFPIYPFDGWRIVRSALCMRFSREKATQIMLIVSLIISLLLVAFGFYYEDKRLMLLGLFGLFMMRRGTAIR